MSTARYCKEWRLDTARNGKRRVPTTEARAHLQRLHASGYTYSQIGRASGLHRTVITHIANGTQRTTRRDIAETILATDMSSERPGDPRLVDATGTRRRIQALVAMGHALAHVSAATGVMPWHLSNIAAGTYTVVRPHTAEKIRATYRDLAVVPGTCTRARKRAEQAGWASPMAWDDIDDPAATPEPEPPRLPRQQLVAARYAEVLHLAQGGVPAEDIATRLDFSVDYVRDVISGQRKPKAAEQLTEPVRLAA